MSDFVTGGHFKWEVKKTSLGYIQATVAGPSAKSAFSNESGGHRWQRIPPTEKRGRVQTSTVTVAVLEENLGTVKDVNPKDVKETLYSGSGSGGQHRNKHANCVRLHHLPTGMIVCSESRSLASNRRDAWQELNRRIHDSQRQTCMEAREEDRKGQVGSGMRGDKRRTYRMKDDRVVDHTTGKKASLKCVMRGELELLWSS